MQETLEDEVVEATIGTTPPRERTLDELDRVKGTLLQTQVNNILLQKKLLFARSQDLQRENTLLDEQLKAKQEEINSFKSSLTAKYEVDFSREQIDVATGRIIPAP